MKLTKNSIIDVTISKLNKDDLGVAYIDDYIITVPYSLIGEVVKVKIVEISGNRLSGQLVDIAKYQDAPCKYFRQCGGCSIQHLPDYQTYKFEKFENSISDIAYDNLHNLRSIGQNSRRRASFKVTGNKLSFNKFHSKDTVAIDNCLLLEDPLNKLINPINKLLAKINAKITNVSILNSDSGIEILFHSSKNSDLNSDILMGEFAHQYNIALIAWVINDSAPYEIISRNKVQLILNEVRIDLPINSFLQVSKESSQMMSEIILEHIDNQGKILELYCGCGSFTIGLASKASVLAVEGNEAATSSLARAAAEYRLPIKTMTRDLYQQPITCDVLNNYTQIVINPPRNGATPQIKQIALALKVKKLILISCSVESFVRDAKILIKDNFILQDIYPIDQFLYSGHLEIIGVFKRA
jgi:23S rRNA (uracil1939-C5)-methyltransferase